jgi:ferric-dicitrate binding protein FerR (iron transport regulator)
VNDEALQDMLRSMGEAPVPPPALSDAEAHARREDVLSAMLAVNAKPRRALPPLPPLPRLPKAARWIGASAAAAMLLVGSTALWRHEPAIGIVHGTGAGVIVLHGRDAQTVDGLSAQSLHAGDRVATLETGRAVVTFEGALATLSPRTELGIRAVPGSSCEVRAGRSHFSVEKRSPSTPFIVRARDVSVVVHGTSFDVSVDAAGVVRVHVDEGVVGVVPPGAEEVRLTAGQDWPPSEPTMRAPSPATSVPLAEAATAPASAASNGAPLALAPAAESPTAPRDGAPRSAHEASLSPRAAAVVPVPRSPEPTAAPTGPATSAAAVAAPAPKSDLAAQNDLLRAAAEARRKGDGAGERRALESFEQRFPDAPGLHDAVVARMRSAAASGERDKARAEARRYLSLFPNGPLRGEATALLP